ncbi:hypothetical protein QBC45DRAFT_420480 [Copromyces sp. CBS 386.78]|nr:hypothetical protein QBC45DRAFT_420480 [Copromyces sp. CBS 386.78]
MSDSGLLGFICSLDMEVSPSSFELQFEHRLRVALCPSPVDDPSSCCECDLAEDGPASPSSLPNPLPFKRFLFMRQAGTWHTGVLPCLSLSSSSALDSWRTSWVLVQASGGTRLLPWPVYIVAALDIVYIVRKQPRRHSSSTPS